MELAVQISLLTPLGLALVWFFAFLIMLSYRAKEEQLHRGWKIEKEKINSQTIAMPFIERQTRVVDAKYEPLIQELERKKKFIKDILPFMSSK